MEKFGCWREAERCDRVAIQLVRIRDELTSAEPTPLVAAVESTSRLLRDVHDLYPLYQTRAPIILYYLALVLPCVSKTSRDMMVCISNEELPSPRQWALVNERLGDQGGMPLVDRFVMYFDFLVQCIRLLSRSPLYDPATLELLRVKILRLRQTRGIPAPPIPLPAHLAPPAPTQQDIERRHWAQKISDDQPQPATGLKHQRPSRCFGPPMTDDRLDLSPEAVVLSKLPFDKNRLSVILYLQDENGEDSRLLCRWMDSHYNPMQSCYGVEGLCIRREGSSLQFRRWRSGRAHSTLWLALFFKTWEKMILFHHTFAALKARSPLTVKMNPDDFKVSGEERLFHHKIVDDGFEHFLSVYQDKKSHGIRIDASVARGPLQRCPIWTAFVTHTSASPNWLTRRSAHRIWINEIRLFVFCSQYKQRHQTRSNGQFEIKFNNERDADDFEDIFRADTPDESRAPTNEEETTEAA